jgi:hypothetical protein
MEKKLNQYTYNFRKILIRTLDRKKDFSCSGANVEEN